MEQLKIYKDCNWSQNPKYENIWDSSCNDTFVFDVGTPVENRFNYCCFCGKRLKEVFRK